MPERPAEFSTANSNPVPNIHPYNKLPGASTGTTSSAGAAGSTTTRLPGLGVAGVKSPEIRSAQPGSAVGSATGSRVGMSTATSSDISEQQRRSAENKTFGRPNEPASTSNPSSAAGSTHSHPVGGGPHHHHHHHHHHHVHPHSSATPTNGASPAAGTSSTTREPERPSLFSTTSAASSTASTNPTSTAPRPAQPTLPSSIGRYPYGMLGSWREAAMLERQKREKEQREQYLDKMEKEKQKAETVTSPTSRTAASPFGRPPGTTSPTVSRATPVSAAGTPSTSIRPSTSPKASTATPSTSVKPNLPVPGYSVLGSRDLPSPFEREKSTATEPPASAASHNRSLSGSSSRQEVAGLSSVQTSPGKAAAKSPEASTRSLFGGPPPLNRPTSAASGGSATPMTTPVSAAGTKIGPRIINTHQRIQPEANKDVAKTENNANRSSYSSYASYAPAYMGFGTSFGNYGYGHTWAERERLKARERERDREKEQAERLARVKRENQQSEMAQQDALRKQRETEASKASPAPVPRDIWGRPIPPPRVTANKTQVEVLNGRRDEPSQTTPAAHSAFPTTATAAGPAVQTPSTGESIIHQVAPSREPRPYTYTAKPEPSPVSTAAAQKEREYNYTPRDKRSRMDAAVDDARRGQANKTKKRKEDEKARSPQAIAPTRDLSSLTREVRKWPEVVSAQVEAWLRNEGDLTRVVAHEVYAGADWTLAQGMSTQRINEGGIVIVRVNGAFLGSSWVVRGEKGWDETTPYPSAGVELGRGITTRKIWGTDVYTDDSDLGLVLIHAGWVRWTRQTPELEDEARKPKQRAKRDDDVIQVTVRVVPRLIRYTATERNGVRTRSWGNGHDGASIVVEGVQRVTLDRKSLKSKPNRKARLAELAREREVVFGASTLGNRVLSLNGTHKPIISTVYGSAIVYNAEAMRNWQEEEPDAFSDDEVDQDSKRPHNMETHGVELFHGRDRYIFWMEDPEAPIVKAQLSQFHYYPRKRRQVLTRRCLRDFMFTDEGLAYKTADDKGMFIPVDSFRFLPFDDVEMFLAEWGDEAVNGTEKEEIGETNDKSATDGVEMMTSG